MINSGKKKFTKIMLPRDQDSIFTSMIPDTMLREYVCKLKSRPRKPISLSPKFETCRNSELGLSLIDKLKKRKHMNPSLSWVGNNSQR